VTKHQRQHRIARLLETRAISSQGQLVELLAAEGVEATQTTVSRDLEELGALKVRLPGGEGAYVLPELPSLQVAPGDHLRRVLGEWAAEVAHSGNLVVIRTPPGCAHVVGSALDRSGLGAVVGTVAGDDTVLVVVAEGYRGARLAAQLTELAGLEPPPAARARSVATAAARQNRNQTARRRAETGAPAGRRPPRSAAREEQ
jgi:transcriptional regulator of arginine metabolism